MCVCVIERALMDRVVSGQSGILEQRRFRNSPQANCPLFLVAPSSFLLLVVRPGATSSVLAPSSDALCSW